MKTTTNSGNSNTGLLPKQDWKVMLAAFPKMSLHDQAVIFMLIKDRASANAGGVH